MALFRRWNKNFFRNPVSVSRDELMKISKIGSVNTYTKCLKQLDAWGFIQYKPSYNRHRGSLIYMFTFDKSSEIDVRPYTNNINNTNRDKQVKNDFEKNAKPQKAENMKNAKSSGYGPDIPPKEEHVQIYFAEKDFPAVEAEKFFNYFQSNGWLVGGRSKMKDWKAAARNWILNAEKFNKHGKNKRNQTRAPKPGNLNTPSNKNYSEPL
jgi:hypothetical protein